jgi:hypothetical protein
MAKGKTITTYLIDGQPNGIRTCFISNKICKAVVVPRAKLMDAKKRSEFQQPALYILLSDSDDKMYIGETEDFLNRIRDHEAKKSFWEQAIIFVSKDNDLTKSDVKYLEYLAIKQAQETARCNIDENKTSPKPTNLPEHQLAFIEEFFEDVCTLATFLGVPVFEKVMRKKQELFYCRTKNTDANGFYTENGFTVLKGAMIPIQSSPVFVGKKKRDEKLKLNSIMVDKETVKLERDLTFKSPSAAASFCYGTASNGWATWVNDTCQTLDEVYRNATERLS